MTRSQERHLAGTITLGQKIRELREARQLSLRALAEKVGVSAPFLSDLEHGRRGTEKVDEIARALGVNANELRKLSGKLTPELKTWLAENPGVVALLQEVRASGRPVDELRVVLKAGPKRGGRRA
jgi:transcriptional regulator with XRE-family HTH domain